MSQTNLFARENSNDQLPLAEISDCQQYRYFLSRQWNSVLPAIAFIGLNPSTADAYEDDPTIRRCVAFAKAWGGGALWMVNLFGYRSTDPRQLLDVKDPIGPHNDQWLDFVVAQAGSTIAAWGNQGTILNRSESILARHGLKLKALQITKTGMPKHPLYVRGDTIPTDFPFIEAQ